MRNLSSILFIFISLDEPERPKTQCEHHRDSVQTTSPEGYPIVGGYVPQCDANGQYIPLQVCHKLSVWKELLSPPTERRLTHFHTNKYIVVVNADIISCSVMVPLDIAGVWKEMDRREQEQEHHLVQHQQTVTNQVRKTHPSWPILKHRCSLSVFFASQFGKIVIIVLGKSHLHFGGISAIYCFTFIKLVNLWATEINNRIKQQKMLIYADDTILVGLITSEEEEEKIWNLKRKRPGFLSLC